MQDMSVLNSKRAQNIYDTVTHIAVFMRDRFSVAFLYKVMSRKFFLKWVRIG